MDNADVEKPLVGDFDRQTSPFQRQASPFERQVSPLQQASYAASMSSANLIGVLEAEESAAQNEEDKEISPAVDFVAAGCISAISKIIVYPMETKVMLMAIGESAGVDSSRLWHGWWVKGIENFMYNGLLWFLKERVRPPPPDPARPEERPPATFIAAFLASCVAILLAHPSVNVVAGMQASLKYTNQPPASALQVAKAIIKSDGIGGFFTAWRFSVALRIGSASTLVVYEFVRARMAGLVGSDLANLLAGLLGRLSEVYCCQPLKTLRSRQQRGQALIASWSPRAVLGLWAGVGTMALADAMKIGIRFLLIERTRALLQFFISRRKRQANKRLKGEDKRH
eukprot:TRINITY_DN122596_c0_g1_i1.p1 TRINITY_DN122596_c0_g1~~TRINITY_DN122596_c0_g1_i1.p1  ORF type:complete len:341 (-),score=33.82 TRINITY_DN122596_c0_g1_i1:157-1179(-)